MPRSLFTFLVVDKDEEEKQKEGGILLFSFNDSPITGIVTHLRSEALDAPPGTIGLFPCDWLSLLLALGSWVSGAAVYH